MRDKSDSQSAAAKRNPFENSRTTSLNDAFRHEVSVLLFFLLKGSEGLKLVDEPGYQFSPREITEKLLRYSLLNQRVNAGRFKHITPAADSDEGEGRGAVEGEVNSRDITDL